MMSVPLIGQPKVAADFFVVFTVQCPTDCDTVHVFRGLPGQYIGCRKCRRVYTLTALPVMTNEGLMIPLSIGHLPEGAERT
jgi:hypothetical protein